MAKTQLGNPNVIIKDVISNERFFIYELVIPENVGVRGKIVDFKKLIIYWMENEMRSFKCFRNFSQF